MKFQVPDFQDDFNSFKSSLRANIPQYIKELYVSGIIESFTPINSQFTGITVAFKEPRVNASIYTTVRYNPDNRQINFSTESILSNKVTKNILAYGYIIVDNNTLKVRHATIYSTTYVGYQLTSHPQKLIPADNISLQDILTNDYFCFFNGHVLYSRYWKLLLTEPESLKLENQNLGHKFNLAAASSRYHIEEILSVYNAQTYASYIK